MERALVLERRGIVMTSPIQTFVHDPFTNTSNEEEFLEISRKFGRTGSSALHALFLSESYKLGEYLNMQHTSLYM